MTSLLQVSLQYVKLTYHKDVMHNCRCIYGGCMTAAIKVIRNRVKAFVDERAISVYRFMQDTGLSQPTAYDLYNDPGKIPTGETLDKICRAYDIQPGVLLEFVDEMSNG